MFTVVLSTSGVTVILPVPNKFLTSVFGRFTIGTLLLVVGPVLRLTCFSAMASASAFNVSNVVSPTNDVNLPSTSVLLYVVDPSAFSAIASASFLRVFDVVSPTNDVNVPSTSV